MTGQLQCRPSPLLWVNPPALVSAEDKILLETEEGEGGATEEGELIELESEFEGAQNVLLAQDGSMLILAWDLPPAEVTNVAVERNINGETWLPFSFYIPAENEAVDPSPDAGNYRFRVKFFYGTDESAWVESNPVDFV